MRTFSAIALVLLVGCGAEAPTQTSDASTSDAPSDASDGSTCARGREVLLGGRCVSATDSNCNGVTCRAGTFCTLDSDGTTTSLVCLAP
jgi:hypothetical protein